MYDREKDLTQQIVRAKSWVLHPFYDSTKARNDIAIIRLQEIASVRPVSLSFDRDFPKPGVITNIFGYGTKSANENELSDKLMETTLSVLDTSVCQGIYGANNVVSVTQICAGGAGKVRTEL
jgi:secreted trypsin-like serine protease